MDNSIEIIGESISAINSHSGTASSSRCSLEVVYDGTASTSTSTQGKVDKKVERTKKAKMLKGISPRPKSSRQRQQVKFLQEEQMAEQKRKKKKQEERLTKQKMGCDTIFVDESEELDVTTKRKGTKRKSTEEAGPPVPNNVKKKPAAGVKKPKLEVGGAGSLKCKKINNDDCQIVFEWDPAKIISERQGVDEWQARSVINLFEQENTLPFIARYRKDKTGNMEVEKLREIQNSYSQLKVVQERIVKVLKNDTVKIPQERKASLLCATTLSEVEHLTAAYKTQSKRTYAERARELGLEPTALEILEGVHNKFINRQELFSLTNPSKDGLRQIEEVEQGLQHIIADVVSKDPQVLGCIRQLIKLCKPMLECSKARRAMKKDSSKSGKVAPSDDLCAKYEHYCNYKNYAWNIKSHEILAMNRGDQQGVLSVRIVISEEAYISFFNFCQQKWLNVCPAHYYRSQLVMKSLEDSWERLVKPFMQRQIRSQLTQNAEIASVEVFAKNLRNLLLTPPIRGSSVLAIDPGYTNGCKIGVTNPQGEKLLTTTIYPFRAKQHLSTDHWTKDHNARTLREIVYKYGCELFVIGNGKGCRETEAYLTKLIQEKCFEPFNVQYSIIDETGVSQYSVTQEARLELPGLDPNHISAVSLARRLQDPLLEYVKVHPMHLGVGMYQHDIPERILHASLDSVVTECVSFVGVDINVASEFILRKLAGLNKARAGQVIEFRKTKGPFVNREQLKLVKGIGPKTFEQCAGFVKILPETLEAQAKRTAKHRKRVESETINALDRTTIHPESYDTATLFMNMVNIKPIDIGTPEFILAIQRFMQSNSLSVVSDQCKVTVSVMQCIIDGLTQPVNYDIRTRFSEPLFRKGITSLDDLRIGTMVTGTVKNVTEFGAFVDIGVGRDGLIHKSKIGGINIELGHIVEVDIISLNQDRTRIGLALKRVLR